MTTPQQAAAGVAEWAGFIIRAPIVLFPMTHLECVAILESAAKGS